MEHVLYFGLFSMAFGGFTAGNFGAMMGGIAGVAIGALVYYSNKRGL